MYSELKTFARNQIVYHQSDPADGMYIVKAGEFKVNFSFERIYVLIQALRCHIKLNLNLRSCWQT